MSYQFRIANNSEIQPIWDILEQAIKRRKADGSDQWQDGYPNPEIVQKDLDSDAGYVLTDGKTIIGYCAIIINDEPEYEKIEGNWLTKGDFVVIHRLVIDEKYLRKGLATMMMGLIEEIALGKNIHSIKADTNYDNQAMLNIFDKLGYSYCGRVYFRGSPRDAYEKVLVPSD